MTIKFTVFKREVANRTEQFYWHMQLGNNEIVAPSEGYVAKQSAHATIESIWFDMAVAQGHPYTFAEEGKPANKDYFLSRCPVHYTHDSL